MCDEVLRIAAAGIRWVRTDGAELAEAVESHPFACHGYEAAFLAAGLLFTDAVMFADAIVIAQLAGVDIVVTGLDAVDQVEHFDCVAGPEGFDGRGRRCGDGCGGRSGCRQDHLGAGELEFHGPAFGEYGQAADDIEYFAGFYQVG